MDLFNRITVIKFSIGSGYTTLNNHAISLLPFLGEHLLYIRDKVTSFVNNQQSAHGEMVVQLLS